MFAFTGLHSWEELATIAGSIANTMARSGEQGQAASASPLDGWEAGSLSPKEEHLLSQLREASALPTGPAFCTLRGGRAAGLRLGGSNLCLGAVVMVGVWKSGG